MHASNQELDRVADRLGALYQHAGRMMPDATDQPQQWEHLLDELVCITQQIEAASGRKKRQRNIRKAARRTRHMPRFIFDVVDGQQWVFDGDTGKEYGPFASAAAAKAWIGEQLATALAAPAKP